MVHLSQFRELSFVSPVEVEVWTQLALVVVGRGVGGSTSWVTPLTEDP